MKYMGYNGKYMATSILVILEIRNKFTLGFTAEKLTAEIFHRALMTMFFICFYIIRSYDKW